MAKTVVIKLKTAGPRIGPFTIKDNYGNVLGMDISREELKRGLPLSVVDEVSVIVISSTGIVKLTKNFPLETFNAYEYAGVKFTNNSISCAWTHLKNPLLYNTYYNNIEPYVIEYPFEYKFNDEILQNVKDYTKVYKYLETGDGVLADYSKYEIDEVWFNKAILYNGQQCSGILNLTPKPQNNLKSYMSFPVINTDSKTILYSKSDNFYQYNTFWNVTKNTTIAQFKKNCESLSIDKEINESNMDYSLRSHKKATFRAKELKVRHILDNRGDINIVSQFILTPAQNSFK